jgi:hypothetical protein
MFVTKDANTSSTHTQHPITKFAQFLRGTPSQQQNLAPIYVPTEYQRQQGYFSGRQESWWYVLKSWLRYYTIQTRWDIERALARLLHRRWGQF